jgi:2-succinyl-6-hydroxy-2,4-cyclohexadiene-1-carboxylate synthase
VPLNVEVRGSGPPLVLLHGFTQTARLWGPFADIMAQEFTLIALDLPGHGGSDAVRADLATTAALVAEAVTSAIGEVPCHLLGYSLGARVALHIAVRGQLPLHRMTLIGATGGIVDEAQRQRRRQADENAAADLESSGDVAGFIDSWVSGPMFASLGEAARPDERRRNSAAGLASSLRLAGTGTQEPLWDALSGVTTPVMALAGTDDARFSARAFRLAREMPACVVTLIPGGGHAVHLAQPATTARLVHHWLAINAIPPQSPS